jgi:hypothetical protein
MKSATQAGFDPGTWEADLPEAEPRVSFKQDGNGKPPGGAGASNATSFIEMLEAVDDYVATCDFARVSEFVIPFTRQLKQDIAKGFPPDAQIYADIEKLQKEATQLYRMLRFNTAFLFVLFLAAADVLPRLARVLAQHSVAPLAAELAALGSVSLLGFCLVFSRLGVRRFYLNKEINHIVKDLAFAVSQKFTKLVADTNLACNQIDARTDFGTGQGWAQRAFGWVRIALWLAMRCVGLDHFTTAAFWKMQVTDTYTERGFRLAKGYLLIIALGFLFNAYQPAGSNWLAAERLCLAAAAGLWTGAWYVLFLRHGKRLHRKWCADFWALFAAYTIVAAAWLFVNPLYETAWPAALMGAIMLAFFWFGWIVAGERDDQELVGIFTAKVDKVTPLNTAYFFNSISSRVQNLVEQIIDAQRSNRGSPPKKDE